MPFSYNVVREKRETVMRQIEDFGTWLKSELDVRGWRQADLAKAANLHSGSVSNVLNGQRRPGPDFVMGVARALKLPAEEVFRRAGLLPPRPAVGGGGLVEEAVDVLKRLPADKQQEALNYIRYLYQQELS